MTHDLPWRVLTREATREVDRMAVEQFGIPSIVLMENAARALCDETARLLRKHASNDDAAVEQSPRRLLQSGRRGDHSTAESRSIDEEPLATSPAHAAPHVAIVCGSGSNGGDGYALARHLHNRGARVSLLPLSDPGPDTDAGINARICERIGLSRHDHAQIGVIGREADLVVDAIFGTGLDRDVTGEAAHLIAVMNDLGRPILAVDVPSGLDCTSGRVLGEAIRATATVTFVGMKPGFLHHAAQEHLGDVAIGDIGAPRELIERLGEVPGPLAEGVREPRVLALPFGNG